MKNLKYLLLLLIALLYACTQTPIETTSNDFSFLRENFNKPPKEYGVSCWWWWLNGNVDKAAITKDLEAMKDRNFFGAMVFDAGGHNHRGNDEIPDGPLYGSKEWNELFLFALDEAERLDLEIGFNIQSGWNVGGPRVTPQYSAKQITFSETIISGNKTINQQLETPPARQDYYQDIATIAVPLLEENKTNITISDLDYKLAVHELGGSAPDTRFLLKNIPRPDKRRRKDQETQMGNPYIINPDQVLDLTSKMDQDGMITWDAPAGNWSILRFGYTVTKSHVSTSSAGWQGNVLDYMSSEAFEFYWNDVVEPIFKVVGKHVGKTLKFMETDSWECGGMNWTKNFREEFKTYRGYDLLHYLPVAAGYVIEDTTTSNNFLADFRKTIGDLVADKHYAEFSRYAKKYQMDILPESAGPHAGPMDGIKNYGFSDIVMSEFWSPSPHRPKPHNRYFLKQASSAAHIYGKKIVGAESFTTIGFHWNDELWHDQKSSFDHEICAGLNRVYFHTFTCSPPSAGLPGQEYFAGTHVNPQVTWWDQSGAFIDYMHRTQLVVQKGKFVADVLYYYGDHVPNVFGIKNSDPAGVLPGFDYDVTNETILLQLKMSDGKIVVPGGVEYRVLVLPDHKVLSLDALNKVEELLQQGAKVIGHKPEKLASLVGSLEDQNQFHKIADKIWGDGNSVKGENKFGKGMVIWGISAREYLLSQQVPIDFNVVGSDSKTDYDYIHYTIDNGHVYFVTNQTTDRQKINCQFRVNGLQPELWDALAGSVRDAQAFTQDGEITTLPLTLEPYEAVMVVFEKEIDNDVNGSALRNYVNYETVQDIEGAWEVNFDTAWGGPASVMFPELMDWSQHTNDAIKYFSGDAIYNKSFTVDFDPQKDKTYTLRLESVKDVGIAEVTINGTNKGILWTKPFRVNISNELQKGENTLQIKVVNSWYNRVVGDQINPEKKQYTKTNINLSVDHRGRPLKEITLEPSGLIGPVTIEKAVME